MKLILPIAIFAVLAATTFAEEKAPTPAPAAPSADTVKVFIPSDLEALRPMKGQKILIEGVVIGTGANKAETIRYLNFTKSYRESVSLVFFANAGGGTFTKEKLASYVNKKIRVNGELTEHNGALQIKIESLDQIKEMPVEPVPAPAPSAQ